MSVDVATPSRFQSPRKNGVLDTATPLSDKIARSFFIAANFGNAPKL